MLLLSLLVETGQLSGTGLTQADKTCIQLNFYLEILKGGHLGFKGGGGKSSPLTPPKCNPEHTFNPLPEQDSLNPVPMIILSNWIMCIWIECLGWTGLERKGAKAELEEGGKLNSKYAKP